ISESFSDQGIIPERYAFAKPDGHAHVALAGNANPQLAWSDAPAATKSFVIICHDPDVPSQPDDVNQEDREIPETLPRVDFYHWVLIDVPAHTTQIAEGSYSNGITPRGKAGPLALDGTRQGLNDYTGWFANDRDMNGDYFGYDGSCPPGTDSIAHPYVFTVSGLDIQERPVEGRFTAKDELDAMQDHIVAQAAITDTYTLHPRLIETQG